jgi:hypothetical protein
MRILRVIGLGLAIIIFQFLLTGVFSAFTDAATQFFQTIQTGLESSEAAVESVEIP